MTLLKEDPTSTGENDMKEDIHVEEDATLNLLEGHTTRSDSQKGNSPAPVDSIATSAIDTSSPPVQKLKEFVTYLDCGMSNDALCAKRAISNFIPPSPLRIQKAKTVISQGEQDNEENLDPVEYSDLTNDSRDIWIVTTGE